MKKKILWLGLGLILVFGAWQLIPKQKHAPTDQLTEVVSAPAGDIRGFAQDGLDVYLGIPYAKPPSGSLRFKAPVPQPKFGSVFNAYEFGAVCPQVYDAVELDDPNEKVDNEDCLTLNIWAPANAEKKAVMVFIHGGGFIAGSSKAGLYHGDAIAKSGDVLVVSMNYRMGLLGYLDFSTLGGTAYADSTNNGLLDQLLALQWVQDNIAAFGGDPQNVTVFGESAGGSSITGLLGIDNPQQYFTRAIVMSGSPYHTAGTAKSIAQLISSETGLTSAWMWQYMPTAGLIYVQDQLLTGVGSPVSDLLFAPAYGENNIMKRTPLEAAEQGKLKGIDLMIGTMANELSYWSFYDTATDHICEQTVADNIVTAIDSTEAAPFKELYDLYRQNPERAGFTEGENVLAVEEDFVFRVPALKLAVAQSQHGNVYFYQADYPVNLPEYPCQNNRAPHGSELPFVFGKAEEQSGIDFIGVSRDAQDTAVRARLTKEMMSAWVNFARTGDPNGAELPAWALFDASTQPTMRFGLTTRLENAPFMQEYLAMSEFMQTFNLFDVFK